VKDRLASLIPKGAADEAFWTVVRENCSLLPDVKAGWIVRVRRLWAHAWFDAEDKAFVPAGVRPAARR